MQPGFTQIPTLGAVGRLEPISAIGLAANADMNPSTSVGHAQSNRLYRERREGGRLKEKQNVDPGDCLCPVWKPSKC